MYKKLCTVISKQTFDPCVLYKVVASIHHHQLLSQLFLAPLLHNIPLFLIMTLTSTGR